MADWQDVLATIPIFSFLGRSELAAVQELFVEETHQKGDRICRQGEEGNTFYVVLDGELDVLAGDQDQHLIAVLKRGDFFGREIRGDVRRGAAKFVDRRLMLACNQHAAACPDATVTVGGAMRLQISMTCGQRG